MTAAVAALTGCGVPYASPGGELGRARRARCATLPVAGPRQPRELVPRLLYYEIAGTVSGPVWGDAFVTDFAIDRPLSRTVVHLSGEGIVHRIDDPDRGPVLCYVRPGARGVILGPSVAEAGDWSASPDGAWLQYRDAHGLHIASTRHEERHTFDAVSAQWAPRATGLWVGLTLGHHAGARRFALVSRPGTDPTVIVSNVAGASWSADGRHLWFTKRSHPDTVFVARADGSEIRPVTPPSAIGTSGHRRVQGDQIWFFPSSPPRVPYVAELGSAAEGTPLALPAGARVHGNAHVLSLDGRHIAYACEVPPAGTHLCVDAVVVARIDVFNPWYLRVRWSPDSAWLAFAVARAGTRELQVIRADGSGRRSIAANVGEVAWSPDSTRLAYYDRDTASVVVAEPDGASPVPVAEVIPAEADGETLPLRITWNDDGAELYYQGSVVSDPMCSHVYRVRADGTEPPALASKRRAVFTFGLLSRETTPLPPPDAWDE